VTPTAALLLSLALAVAVADWFAVGARNRVAEYVSKPLTMVVLIAAALALTPVSDSVRAWFLVGLAFSLAGDVFLMLPRNLFVAGLGSFLLAHVAYIVGLIARGQHVGWLLAGVAVVVVALAAVGRPVLRAVRAGDEPALLGPVTAYMVVISTMVACAFGTRNGFAIVGASLFYASDSLIAWGRFLHDREWGRLAVMVTYHLGQIGLVLSIIG